MATRHFADQNYHRAAKAHRTAIALEPGEPMPYFNLRAALGSAGRPAEAVPRFLQAAALSSEGWVQWAAETDRQTDRQIYGRKEARTSDLRRYNYNV